MKDLIDNQSNVRCRLGFFEKSNKLSTKMPLKFSKTLTRRLLQQSIGSKPEWVVNEPIDLNVMLIVELRARHHKNILKSALISRQVQHYNVHIPGVRTDTLLRESEYFVGGQQHSPRSYLISEDEPQQKSLPGGLFRGLFQRKKRAVMSYSYQFHWGPNGRYYGRYKSKNSMKMASRRSETASESIKKTDRAGSSSNRRVYADKSTAGHGLKYKYRWRLKVYNKDVWMVLKNVTMDQHDEGLLRNLTEEGCSKGFTGDYCDVRKFEYVFDSLSHLMTQCQTLILSNFQKGERECLSTSGHC